MLKPINACSTSLPAQMLRKVSVRAWRTQKKERPGPRRSFSTSLKPRMAFLVNITSRAERGIAHLYSEINTEHSGAALKWYRGLKEAILSLQERPIRYPITRKRDHLRHLLYGHKFHVYRVIFRVLPKQKQVEVLHIRHAASRKLKPSD